MKIDRVRFAGPSGVPTKTMSSTFDFTYYNDDYDEYYDVTELGEYVILRTHQYGYTYVLSYDRLARKYNVVSTTNPNLFPKQ